MKIFNEALLNQGQRNGNVVIFLKPKEAEMLLRMCEYALNSKFDCEATNKELWGKMLKEYWNKISYQQFL